MGNAVAGGICHCFAADGRCISLLKILYTNECIFDCKYCVNRRSNDIPRASFTPEEVAELTISFYKRNYIEGLFMSSGILESPDYTMEKLYQVVYLLRNRYQFNGYIHVKAIPGADPVLIEKTGWLADRMSINLELPTSEGLQKLAPHKNRTSILRPMKQIQLGVNQTRRIASPNLLEYSEAFERKQITGGDLKEVKEIKETSMALSSEKMELMAKSTVQKFVPAGQSTQMIVGATGESDYEIIGVAEALYQKFALKRVFYSAFINTTMDSELPVLQDGPPLLREHRLYQADWLLRFYGFSAKEILSEKNPNLNVMLDPKCNWAMNHLEEFPIEVTRATYYTLLRVPGIGVKSARRIVAARRLGKITFTDLKKFGVVLKRAVYFITCNGRMMYTMKIEEKFILSNLLQIDDGIRVGLDKEQTYEQISLFSKGV